MEWRAEQAVQALVWLLQHKWNSQHVPTWHVAGAQLITVIQQLILCTYHVSSIVVRRTALEALSRLRVDSYHRLLYRVCVKLLVLVLLLVLRIADELHCSREYQRHSSQWETSSVPRHPPLHRQHQQVERMTLERHLLRVAPPVVPRPSRPNAAVLTMDARSITRRCRYCRSIWHASRVSSTRSTLRHSCSRCAPSRSSSTAAAPS